MNGTMGNFYSTHYTTNGFTSFFNSPCVGEKSLWRAVIVQAITDAISTSNKKQARLDRRTAISWLSGISSDFKTVCALADLDAKLVQKKIRELLVGGNSSIKDLEIKSCEPHAEIIPHPSSRSLSR